MPFDDTSFLKTKPGQTGTNPHPVYSLEGLIWWLERQPGETKYCYLSNGRCLWGRYFRSRGAKNISIGGSCYDYDLNGKHFGGRLSREFNGLAQERPRRFAAALSRAQALQQARHE